ncbi:MAG: type IIL restriction-modification enzyme MmeI, partial [Nocardioidaceae bacterium]
MARSGLEIQAALRKFAAKWASYSGSERGEAQTFLNELFACYGTDRHHVGGIFEDFAASAGFMDLHWPGICIIEMKAPSRDVSVGREQVKRYWEASSDPERDIGAVRWVVICNFAQLEIWEPGRFPRNPRVTVALTDLPDRYDVLNFLAGPNVEPIFVEHHRQLTKEAAEKVAACYQSLVDRTAAPPDEIQRFVMQTVWCMFAEDLLMLGGWPLQGTIKRLLQHPDRSPAAEIGMLFRVLNQKGSHNRKGLLEGTTYVNGELFAEPAAVELNHEELQLLLDASQFDWRVVDPTIFGSLMEGVLGHDRRWELGAHYTHEADIMKIVTPTIVRPWHERIDAVESPSEARALLDELCAFTVLDPACGCGNFLYVAYRELRALEHELKERITELAAAKGLAVPARPWPFVPLTNVQGNDIERAAVMIARVTLWMGHRQMIDLYGEA